MKEQNQNIATREAFGQTLAELGAKDERIVVLDADLASSTKITYFRDIAPERFLQMGIAEQNMVGVAVGLTLLGKIPFGASFSTFISRRACDQVAVSVGHTGANVKMIGAYGGLVNGNNGATHQAVEDLAIMRSVPGIAVIEPADDLEMRMAVPAIIEYGGPVYLRCTRDPWPRVNPEGYRFKIGKAVKVREGRDITIIGAGMMVSQALIAAETLAQEGIEAEVINCATIKPLDVATIVESAARTGAVVTVENHNIIGGLGSAVAEALVENCPVPMGRIGLQDVYGECGDNNALLRKYQMDPDAIVAKTKAVLGKKK